MNSNIYPEEEADQLQQEALAAAAEQKKTELYAFWLEQSKVLARFGCYQKALSSIDQALMIKPGSHQAWIFRGNMLLYLERDEAALTSFQQALKILPQHQAALFYCSVALYNLGQHKEAYLIYKKAIEQGQQPILRKLHQFFHSHVLTHSEFSENQD